jgi:hypothetical protein
MNMLAFENSTGANFHHTRRGIRRTGYEHRKIITT